MSNDRYVAVIQFSTGSGVWGQNTSSDAAIKEALRHLKEFAHPFGGLKTGGSFIVNVFAVPDGFYWFHDERGNFLADRETEKVIGYARLARLVEVTVGPKGRMPTSNWRMKSIEDINARIDEANAKHYPKH